MARTKVAGQPTERVRQAVLNCTRDLLDEAGFSKLSVEAIAERSGVSKATIYRWWPNRAAVAMDTLLEVAGPNQAILHEGSALSNLRTHVRIAGEFIGGKTGGTLAGLVADLQHDPELAEAFRTRYLAERRGMTCEVIARAIEEGDLDAELDPGFVVDLLIGPLYYRLLLGHDDVDPDVAERVLDRLLDGLRKVG